jgi:hypothetical protein
LNQELGIRRLKKGVGIIRMDKIKKCRGQIYLVKVYNKITGA